MKQLLPCLLFTICISSLNTQNSQTAYHQWADSVYAGLDEQYITTGVLADKGQLNKIFGAYRMANDSATDYKYKYLSPQSPL